MLGSAVYVDIRERERDRLAEGLNWIPFLNDGLVSQRMSIYCAGRDAMMQELLVSPYACMHKLQCCTYCNKQWVCSNFV